MVRDQNPLLHPDLAPTKQSRENENGQKKVILYMRVFFIIIALITCLSFMAKIFLPQQAANTRTQDAAGISATQHKVFVTGFNNVP